MDVMEYFDESEREECYRNLRENVSDGGLLPQMPLGGEIIDEIIAQLKNVFEIKSVDYVYGQLWYEMLETRLYWIVNALYFRKRILPLHIIGTVAYEIMKKRTPQKIAYCNFLYMCLKARKDMEYQDIIKEENFYRHMKRLNWIMSQTQKGERILEVGLNPAHILRNRGKLIVTVPNGNGSYENRKKYFKKPVERINALIEPYYRMRYKIKVLVKNNL